MGEEDLSKMEYMEYYNRDDTIVLWNLDDYPIPDGADLGSFRRNIEEALNLIGFCGHKEFRGCCDNLKHLRDKLLNAQFYLLESKSAVFRMALKMIFVAKENDGQRTNFLVIAKPSPGGELHRVQQCMKSREHRVLVFDEHTAATQGFQSVESLVHCIHVLGGPKPKIITWPDTLSFDTDEDACSEELPFQSLVDYSSDSASDIREEVACSQYDISKMEDFSERITPVKGDKTVVFWDVVDCPFPLGLDPDEIYRRIYRALGETGFGGETSIFAYVDENNNDGSWRERLGNKTWKSRIYFLPGGDKASRPNRMLHDILLWEMDSPVHYPVPAFVIAVADQFRADTDFFRYLRYLSMRCDGLSLVVNPTPDANNPKSSEWPRLLLDEAQDFGYKTECSEPNRKKNKPDATDQA